MVLIFSSSYLYKMKNRTARRKCREKKVRRQLKINSTLNTRQLFIVLVAYLLEKAFDVARDYMLANQLLNHWVRTSVKLCQETQTEALRRRIIFSDKYEKEGKKYRLKNHFCSILNLERIIFYPNNICSEYTLKLMLAQVITSYRERAMLPHGLHAANLNALHRVRRL